MMLGTTNIKFALQIIFLCSFRGVIHLVTGLHKPAAELQIMCIQNFVYLERKIRKLK